MPLCRNKFFLLFLQYLFFFVARSFFTDPLHFDGVAALSFKNRQYTGFTLMMSWKNTFASQRKRWRMFIEKKICCRKLAFLFYCSSFFHFCAKSKKDDFFDEMKKPFKPNGSCVFFSFVRSFSIFNFFTLIDEIVIKFKKNYTFLVKIFILRSSSNDRPANNVKRIKFNDF